MPEVFCSGLTCAQPGNSLICDLAALELQQARVVVAHVRPGDAVQERLALLPVLVELDELEFLALRPVVPLERAGPHRRVVELGLRLAVIALRHDGVREERDVGHHGRPLELRLDDDRVLVLGRHALDRTVDVAPPVLRVARGVERELDVRGRHLLARVEQHAVTEVERVRLLVGRQVVARREPRLHVLAVGRDRVERLHHLLQDPDGLVVEDGRRVHLGRVLRARDDEVSALDGRRGSVRTTCRCARPDRQRGEQRSAGERGKHGKTGTSDHVPSWQRRRSREVWQTARQI